MSWKTPRVIEIAVPDPRNSETILRKIEVADGFFAGMPFAAVMGGGKPMPNPNVMESLAMPHLPSGRQVASSESCASVEAAIRDCSYRHFTGLF
jgi:hypothetical protein